MQGEILRHLPLRAFLYFSYILQRAHMFLNQINSIYTCVFLFYGIVNLLLKYLGGKNVTSQNDI